MNKATRLGVVGVGLLALVGGLGASEARDEQSDPVELTIQGEPLLVLLESFGTQHGHNFIIDMRVAENRPAPYLYASGLSLSRAVAVIAAAYGACAVQVSAKLTRIMPAPMSIERCPSSRPAKAIHGTCEDTRALWLTLGGSVPATLSRLPSLDC